jgi:ubiquinone/menaquinone biosynthesis C-methylase UbiE
VNHSDHVALLRPGVLDSGREGAANNMVWADLGAGSGAFTLALAELLPAAEIIAVDRDLAALQAAERAFHERFPHARVRYITADFTQPLDLPPLDGIVIANALHYIPDSAKEPVVRGLARLLKPDGRLIVVEYNVDRGNTWVPYPLSYPTWEALAHRIGFTHTRLLGRVPSRFLGEFYSAVSW